MTEKARGKEHPLTLVSINNLALVLFEKGEYEEAEKLHQKGLNAREKVLGKGHPDTLSSVYSLAILYRKLKKYDTAFELYEWACDGYKRTFGPTHYKTVQCFKEFSGMVQEMSLNKQH